MYRVERMIDRISPRDFMRNAAEPREALMRVYGYLLFVFAAAVICHEVTICRCHIYILLW